MIRDKRWLILLAFVLGVVIGGAFFLIGKDEDSKTAQEIGKTQHSKEVKAIGEDPDSKKAKEIALKFYKAVKIEGNKDKALSYCDLNDSDSYLIMNINAYVIDSSFRDKKIVKVLNYTDTIAPESDQGDVKEFYIYEPIIKKTYYIQLKKNENQEWKVHKLYSPGYYDEIPNYERLNEMYPDLESKWEEVEIQ